MGTGYLFANDNGNKPFKFAAVPKLEAAAPTRKDFPFTLVCGSSLYYWNQNVLVRHSEALRREYSILLTDYPEGFVEIHPEDAKELQIRDGGKVRLWSETASAVSTARVTAEVRKGTIFVPYFERELEKQMLGSSRSGAALVPVRVEKEKA